MMLARNERAAKAAYETFSGKRQHIAWDKLLTPTRERWREIARAALEAALSAHETKSSSDE